MHNLTVSIILPFHNAECYLGAAINSVRMQSITDWELILIDDGSTDSSYSIATQMLDPRIRLFRQSNQGVSAARNLGLLQASGGFVTFMDADDLLPECSLEIRRGIFLSSPQVDIVGGSIYLFSSESPYVGFVRMVAGGYRGLYWPMIVSVDQKVYFSAFVMLRSQLATSAKFQVGLSHCEDLLYLITIAQGRNLWFASSTEVTYFYRTGHPSAMSNITGLVAGYLHLLDSVRRFSSVSFSDFFTLYKRVSLVLLKICLRKFSIISVPSVLVRLILVITFGNFRR